MGAVLLAVDVYSSFMLTPRAADIVERVMRRFRILSQSQSSGTTAWALLLEKQLLYPNDMEAKHKDISKHHSRYDMNKEEQVDFNIDENTRRFKYP